MVEPANQALFEQPHWRVIAQGYRTEDWFHRGQASGTGGIRHPEPIHLRSGHYYYRFASSDSSRAEQLGGGWWLDFENYRKIETFARQHGYRVREAARLMLALPYAWTRVDLRVRALLAVPLKAYAGEGRPARSVGDARDRGGAWIPTQHIKILQLYIPGLFVRGRRPREQLFEKAFPSPTVEPVR